MSCLSLTLHTENEGHVNKQIQILIYSPTTFDANSHTIINFVLYDPQRLVSSKWTNRPAVVAWIVSALSHIQLRECSGDRWIESH